MTSNRRVVTSYCFVLIFLIVLLSPVLTSADDQQIMQGYALANAKEQVEKLWDSPGYKAWVRNIIEMETLHTFSDETFDTAWNNGKIAMFDAIYGEEKDFESSTFATTDIITYEIKLNPSRFGKLLEQKAPYGINMHGTLVHEGLHVVNSSLGIFKDSTQILFGPESSAIFFDYDIHHCITGASFTGYSVGFELLCSLKQGEAGELLNANIEQFNDDPFFTIFGVNANDLDGDGQLNENDPDMDGDGYLDVGELKVGLDRTNPDSDEDGHFDGIDIFPHDYTEWEDMDGDGVGDNKDPCSSTECSSNPYDTDGDGYNDFIDAFPTDPEEFEDHDGDGWGDNSDPCSSVDDDCCIHEGECNPADMDGDEVPDGMDGDPLDAGIGANTDHDDLLDNDLEEI